MSDDSRNQTNQKLLTEAPLINRPILRRTTHAALVSYLVSAFAAIAIVTVGWISIFVTEAVKGTSFSDMGIVVSPLISINGKSATWLLIVGLFIVISLVTSFVTAITNASLTRTYLGAGLPRKSTLATFASSWIIGALAAAVGLLIIALITMAIYGDFSGTLFLKDAAAPDGQDVKTILGFSGSVVTSLAAPQVLWFAPIAFFAGLLTAAFSGYAIAIVFVRFPWWLPIGVAVVVQVVVSTLSKWMEFPAIDRFPLASTDSLAGNLLVSLGWTLLGWLIVGSVLAFISLRRLPIRR